MFSMQCLIGTRKFEYAMIDLWSAINIMQVPVYFEFQSLIMHPTNI